MSEPEARLWLVQADSDLLCAQRAWDESDHRTYCQVVSKYQQIVEKSVKAVFAGLKDHGVSGLPFVGYSHDLVKLLDALARLPRSRDGMDLQRKVDGLLTHYHREEIAAISALAPKRPAMSGELHRLNTEYPYEVASGVWQAPAAASSFSLQQVQRFRTLAHYLYSGACKVVSSLRR